MSTLTLPTDAGLDVLKTIVEAEEAWCEAAPIEARWPGELARLVGLGLVELWPRPDYLAVTLSALAAELLEVQVLEHWRMESRDVGQEQSPKSHHVECVAEEVPMWAPAGREPGPIHLPRFAHEVSLQFPSRLPDHRAPVQAVDDTTGEPLKVMGRPVLVDRRLAR